MVLDAPEQLKEAPIRRLKDELEQLEPGVLKQERDGESMAELSHEHGRSASRSRASLQTEKADVTASPDEGCTLVKRLPDRERIYCVRSS